MADPGAPPRRPLIGKQLSADDSITVKFPCLFSGHSRIDTLDGVAGVDVVKRGAGFYNCFCPIRPMNSSKSFSHKENGWSFLGKSAIFFTKEGGQSNPRAALPFPSNRSDSWRNIRARMNIRLLGLGYVAPLRKPSG